MKNALLLIQFFVTRIAFLFTFLYLFVSASMVETEGILSVVVSNIDPSKGGNVRVAIYNSADGFLEPKRFAFVNSIAANQKTIRFDFKMPHGSYAATSYQDFNGNRTIDRNSVGVPTEPYALSNNVAVKWRKPTFHETKFGFTQPNQQINLELKYWQER